MYQVIGVPLGLVALDIGSDWNLLVFMESFLDATNTTVLTNNSTENNFTMQHSNSSIEAGNEQRARALYGLFAGSCCVLFFSLMNLILENPAKTLIRSVRTSALMGSREMNAKDVPVPIGKIYFRINHISKILHDLGGKELIGKAHTKKQISMIFSKYRGEGWYSRKCIYYKDHYCVSPQTT